MKNKVIKFEFEIRGLKKLKAEELLTIIITFVESLGLKVTDGYSEVESEVENGEEETA